jgi:hypothetical protein
MFRPVPGLEIAQIADTEGTKSGMDAEIGAAADNGITPVKSAAKALYAVQSCYEGSPSRPRGATVGRRRFA